MSGVPPVEPSEPPSAPAPVVPEHPAPPPGALRRHPGVAVGAVVVVVVIVIASLFWLGTFAGSSAGGLSGTPSFLPALSAANAAAGGVPGGPWPTIVAAGVALSAPVTESAANISSASTLLGCTFAWVGTPPTAVTFPSTPSSTAAGKAAVWAFLATNSTDAALVTLAINSTVTNLFTLSGETCSADFMGFSGIPTSVVDSTAAAVSANSVGGTAFLASHPNAQRSYEIVAIGGVFSFAIWEVAYTTCTPLSPSNSTGVAFNVTENAATGVPVLPGGAATVSCGSAPFE